MSKASHVAGGESTPRVDLLAEAGVGIGDEVTWQWNMPLYGPSDPQRVTVVGEHVNDAGFSAVEVRAEDGRTYRAYPGELVFDAAENGASPKAVATDGTLAEEKRV